MMEAGSSSGESGDENDGEQAHQQLLEQVHSLAKRCREEERTEGPATASDYHLTPALRAEAVSVESLLSGLGKVGSKSLQALKQRLSQVEERNSTVEPPLSKVQADKANRRAANEESCKEVGKWAPIVKKNREAEHLSFPIQPDHIPPPSLASKVESFTPTTELEKEVAAILEASHHVEKPDQELTQAEKKSLMQMTVEEAMERRRELQKHRALVSYYEQKCRRIRRIKSKKFHKIQRKRNEKLGIKGEVTEEALVKLRAKERMTLKHSSRAKWARKQHAREHRDPATQQALSEHHNMKTKLRQKVAEEEEEEEEGEGEGNSTSNEESEGEEADIEDRPSIAATNLGNPWLGSTGGTTTLSGSSGAKTASSVVIDTNARFSVTEGRGRGGDGGGLGAASQQLLAVREAFSGDNVVQEFEREKAELQEQEMEKDAPAVLPGWGSWGGEGVRPPKRARQNKQRPPPRKRRKDANLKNVIIFEENKNRKIEQHLVNEIPWPYTSKDQFDKTHSMPVGRHWNTEATFRNMIKPRVSTSTGEIIQPLVLTEEVRHFIKRKRAQKT